ncbi:hypothetical protein S83_060149 [Arachis hypogaea]
MIPIRASTPPLFQKLHRRCLSALHRRCTELPSHRSSITPPPSSSSCVARVASYRTLMCRNRRNRSVSISPQLCSFFASRLIHRLSLNFAARYRRSSLGII